MSDFLLRAYHSPTRYAELVRMYESPSDNPRVWQIRDRLEYLDTLVFKYEDGPAPLHR